MRTHCAPCSVCPPLWALTPGTALRQGPPLLASPMRMPSSEAMGSLPPPGPTFPPWGAASNSLGSGLESHRLRPGERGCPWEKNGAKAWRCVALGNAERLAWLKQSANVDGLTENAAGGWGIDMSPGALCAPPSLLALPLPREHQHLRVRVSSTASPPPRGPETLRHCLLPTRRAGCLAYLSASSFTDPPPPPPRPPRVRVRDMSFQMPPVSQLVPL